MNMDIPVDVLGVPVGFGDLGDSLILENAGKDFEI